MKKRYLSPRWLGCAGSLVQASTFLALGLVLAGYWIGAVLAVLAAVLWCVLMFALATQTREFADLTAICQRDIDLDRLCADCGHALGRHQADPEGACYDCHCLGWNP